MSDETTRINEYRPRLVIYVVWHPGFERGRELAERIYAHFSRDPERPNARGIGIPVFFRSATTADDQAPPPISIESARHTTVIALVDVEMITGSPAWKSYVTSSGKRRARGQSGIVCFRSPSPRALCTPEQSHRRGKFHSPAKRAAGDRSQPAAQPLDE